MAPEPYQRSRGTQAESRNPSTTFACPSCAGTLGLRGGVWTCSDCGYAPRQGAD